VFSVVHVEGVIQVDTGQYREDIKIGQYVTPLGAEVIDPRGNFFYSHDYVFNFGLPLRHTGILADTHVNSMLDLYYGVDTGVKATFGAPADPNGSASFLGGFGLNLLKGDLTILALTHIGKVLPDQGGMRARAHGETVTLFRRREGRTLHACVTGSTPSNCV